MPYDIKRGGKGCKGGFEVVGPHGSHGCHQTRASAIQQQRALYAAEAASKKSLGSVLLGKYKKSEDNIVTNEDTPNMKPHSLENCPDPKNCPEHMNKKDYSPKQRRALAARGFAMPDGSFPIVTEQDLRNAIQSVGRASNYEEAKRHITRRARSLGRLDLLPSEWNASTKKSLFIDLFKFNRGL